MNKTLLYIAGPTASGKTAAALKIATHFNTEIVSCDSRQFYKEMKIGTAPPSPEELAQVPHHFIHNKSLASPYTVGAYEKEALACVERLFEHQDVVVLVGGSGLYADALIEGLDQFPEVPQALHDQLELFYQQHGLEGLQDLLKQKDLKYYQQVDRNNPRRMLRALGVCIVAEQPYSSFLQQEKVPRNFTTRYLVLMPEREELYQRINSRVDSMLDNGLEEEAAALADYQNHPAFATVGYQEWLPFWNGDYDRDTAIERIKRNSRRYAKRQITWCKRYGAAHFYTPPIELEAVLKKIF